MRLRHSDFGLVWHKSYIVLPRDAALAIDPSTLKSDISHHINVIHRRTSRLLHQQTLILVQNVTNSARPRPFSWASTTLLAHAQTTIRESEDLILIDHHSSHSRNPHRATKSDGCSAAA